MERCKKGTRRNKKTGDCEETVKKSIAKAKVMPNREKSNENDVFIGLKNVVYKKETVENEGSPSHYSVKSHRSVLKEYPNAYFPRSSSLKKKTVRCKKGTQRNKITKVCEPIAAVSVKPVSREEVSTEKFLSAKGVSPELPLGHYAQLLLQTSNCNPNMFPIGKNGKCIKVKDYEYYFIENLYDDIPDNIFANKLIPLLSSCIIRDLNRFKDFTKNANTSDKITMIATAWFDLDEKLDKKFVKNLKTKKGMDNYHSMLDAIFAKVEEHYKEVIDAEKNERQNNQPKETLNHYYRDLLTQPSSCRKNTYPLGKTGKCVRLDETEYYFFKNVYDEIPENIPMKDLIDFFTLHVIKHFEQLDKNNDIVTGKAYSDIIESWFRLDEEHDKKIFKTTKSKIGFSNYVNCLNAIEKNVILHFENKLGV